MRTRLIMADVAARAILASQADALPGQLAVELEAEANFHPVVHQAAGMVSIQLDVTVGEALIRLRRVPSRQTVSWPTSPPTWSPAGCVSTVQATSKGHIRLATSVVNWTLSLLKSTCTCTLSPARPDPVRR